MKFHEALKEISNFKWTDSHGIMVSDIYMDEQTVAWIAHLLGGLELRTSP